MNDSQDFISELKQRARLEDVASWYVKLIRKGGSYWACCPFHNENGPSFKLNDDNTYHCFGCGKHGDVITFIQEIENLSFGEAVEFLAGKFNMEVPKYKKNKDAENAKAKRDRLYDLTRATGQFYHEMLVNDKRGEKALNYLYSRGLSMDTIRAFGLGYSPNSYELIQHLKSKGFKEEEMAEAKVAYISKDKCYDPQHERFVTPIINVTKNIVAFGGRIIEKRDDIAKYYNSMESYIFHKSKELFAQNILKSQKGIDDAILVEGYMDVITLYQAGFHNAVASMGTSLTEDQARVLKRFVKKVYFMYDGDSAGQNGMLRGVDILKNAGLDVYCVVLEDNLDPDEYIKKFGADALRKKIYEQAVSMYRFRIDKIAEKSDLNTVAGRETFARDAILAMIDVKSETQVEPLLQYIESKSAISTMFLLEEYRKAKDGQAIEIKQNNEVAAKDPMSKAIRFIIYAAFGGVNGVKVLDEYGDCIKNKLLLDIYNVFREKESVDLEDLEVLKEGNVEIEKILEEGELINPKFAKKYYEDCRKMVLTQLYNEQSQRLLNEIRDADEETKQLLLTQIMQITESINNLGR